VGTPRHAAADAGILSSETDGGNIPLENFFLAGDWVNVGLPPTIETACRSGHRAAALACAYLSNRTKETAPC
jgi:uncharacterized protein with NAD-binding domain and iron-sulfur cluster